MPFDLPTIAQLVSTFTVVAGFIFAVYQTLNIRRQPPRRDRAHAHPHHHPAGAVRDHGDRAAR